ncbi:MAG: hypothetical protein NVS1B14_01040 [Vulcanimicrobiaceae bacterium]
MDFFGTRFSLTLGSWRLRFVLSLEEIEEGASMHDRKRRPHHLDARKLLNVR